MSIDDVPEIDINCDENQITPQKIEPDKRLENWERWMEVRKRIHRKFERKPGKLLINTAEDRKEFDEKRRNIEYARIPKWDKYRGNPMIWALPPMLAKRCPNDLEYRITLTQQEKGLIPEIEYVKVPDVIKEEKEVVCTRNAYDLNKSKYFLKKLNHERVLQLLPHRPQMEKIVIIGKSLQQEVVEPVKQYSTDLFEDEEKFVTMNGIDYLLSLNNLQLFPNDKGIQNVKLFLEGSPNNVEFLYLTIHNNSDTAIRFVLQKYSQRRVLGKIMPEDYDDLFFWNKNVHVILPAEKINCSIYFKSSTCGSYTYTLQMLTKPNFWDSLKILINIQVNIINLNFEDWSWNITMQLENQIRERMISETLDSVLEKIPPKKSDIIMYSYDKAAIFEAVNAFYSNNQFCVRYVYDKNVVDELEKFYENVRLDRHPELWDYRIETLRTVTKHRENYMMVLKLQDDLDNLRVKIDECNAKREKLELQVKSFWDENKDKKKGKGKGKDKKEKITKQVKKVDKASNKSKKSKKSDGKDKKKKGSVKLVERPRPPLPKTLSDDLEDVIAKLHMPSTWKKEFSRKIQICYTLLCAYIDKICAECSELEKMFGIIKVNPKVLEKIYVEHNRIYDEELDDTNMQYPKIVDLILTTKDKPAPAWSTTIPLENYEERYAAFKAEKKTPGVKNTPRKITVVEAHEELGEMYIEEEKEFIPPEIYDHYKNNLYIIFNCNLWMFIDDMLATFELVPKPQIELDVLRQIGLNDDLNLGEDENEVRIFDLKKTIIEVLKESEVKEEAVCTCECVCEINQSLQDLFTIYQSKPCAVSKDTDDDIAVFAATEAARVRAERFQDVAVMTTPSINIPAEILYDGGGVCGKVTEEESEECICKVKRLSSDFHYYNSVIGFDTSKSDVSSSDEHSCKME